VRFFLTFLGPTSGELSLELVQRELDFSIVLGLAGVKILRYAWRGETCSPKGPTPREEMAKMR
jgi:hypothetical protein